MLKAYKTHTNPHVSRLSGLVLAGGMALIMTACSKPAEVSKAEATAARAEWGALSDGTKVEAVELKNSKGVTARVITYGATLQDLLVPGKDGKAADVVIGYDSIEGYEKTPGYTGVTVGRYANRIAKGKFSIDGKAYTLAINNAPNALHGGVKGWDKRNWTIKDVKSGGDAASVTLTYTSPDGEEGYPGTVLAEVTYTLNENNDLTVSYKATTDKPTVINMTNHSLFNLGGVPVTRSALDAYLKIESDAILPVDKTLIPTGKEQAVKGTPFDFTTSALISERVTRKTRRSSSATRASTTTTSSVAVRPRRLSWRSPSKTRPQVAAMTIATTEPGIQMYTGNFLDGTVAGKGGQKLTKYQAVAFEAQRYPDSPNQPAFPTSRLNPGETYTQTTVHHFYTLP